MTPEPRRPFQDAQPPPSFSQTPEFRRFVWLFGLAALLGIGFYMFQFTRAAAERAPEVAKARATAAALVPKDKLSPEELAARQAALFSKLEGALADTQNGQPLNQETPGYWKLLETLVRYTPEEVEQRSTRDFDWEAAMADPDAWRGEFVRARAIIGPSYAYKLSRPILGRKDVYRALLTSDDNYEKKNENGEDANPHIFMAEFVDYPPELAPETRVAADISGIFYRTVRYETRNAGVQELPYILVRNVREVPAAAEVGIRAWLTEHGLSVLAGMAVLVFGVRLLFSWFQHRARSTRTRPVVTGSFQQMFDKKLRAAGKVPPPPQ